MHVTVFNGATMLIINCHIFSPGVRDSEHPMVAVVFDPFWEEESGLLWHHSKSKYLFLVQQRSLSKENTLLWTDSPLSLSFYSGQCPS